MLAVALILLSQEKWLRHVIPDPSGPTKPGWVVALPSQFRDLNPGPQQVFKFVQDKRNEVEINRAWASDKWLADHRKKEAKLGAHIEHRAIGRYDVELYAGVLKGGSLGFVEIVSKKGPSHSVLHCLAGTQRTVDGCRDLLWRFAQEYAKANP